MLRQSGELHISEESGFLDKLSGRQAAYGDFGHAYQRWFFIRDLQTNQATSRTRTFPIFELTVHEAEAALAGAAPTDFAGASAALFAASARKKGKSRWGDKTPRYVLRLDWLAQVFPQAQYVHLIRDGRDVADSIRRAGWRPQTRGGAAYWKQRVEAGREAGSALSPERYREVRYEALVRDPESTLRSLCAWLKLAYTPAMLSFHREETARRVADAHADLLAMVERPVDPSRAQAWKRSMPRREVAEVEAAAGDLLADLGYELTGARLPLWTRSLRRARQAAAPLARKARGLLHPLG